MKKINRFGTIDTHRVITDENITVDFKIIIDKIDYDNPEYYLVEDGDFDFTIYKIDNKFNKNMLDVLPLEYYREHYVQLNEFDSKESILLEDLINYLHGDNQMITI